MQYQLDTDLAAKRGTVSNMHGLFHRSLDTGFRSVWSGYWVPPVKYLDYLAFRVNGTWLGPGTVEETIYGADMCSYHDIDGFSVTERVTTPPDTPGILVTLEITNDAEEQAVAVETEVGVALRRKAEDTGFDQYQVDTRHDQLIISRDSHRLMLHSDESFTVNGDPRMEQVGQGQERSAFIPGRVTHTDFLAAGETATVTLELTTDRPRFGEIETIPQQLDGTPFDDAMHGAITSLTNMVYDRNGTGVFAGHPWSQQYRARDALWSVIGLIDAGHFRVAEQVLETVADSEFSGRIPLEEGNGIASPAADTLPLFIIAADRLARYHGPTPGLRRAQSEAMASLDIDADGLVEHDPKSTWMNTLERHKAVEIQSLWLEAATIMRDRRRHELRNGLELFFGDERIQDTLGGDTVVTANATVPLLLGQVDRSRAEIYLDTLNDELVSRYGARTRSPYSDRYSPDGYHTGAVWGLTTAWLAGANLRYGNTRTGIDSLNRFAQLLPQDQPGALPELVHAETGETLGCPEQAWSAGMLVHVVDRYLLGISVDEGLTVDPVEEVSATRTGKQVRDRSVTVTVEDGEASVEGWR